MGKELKRSRITIYEQVENISRHIILKILKLKYTVAEI
jgi:hypothetical protein